MTTQEKKKMLEDLNMEETAKRAAVLGAQDQNKKTLEYKKEAIRRIIVSAVPGLMDLKMGCEIFVRVSFNGDKYDWGKGIYLFSQADTERVGNEVFLYRNNQVEHGYVEKIEDITIIGRPISLFDTSKVVKDKHTLIDMWTEGSLDDQSDETIAWIYEDML